MGEAFAPDGRVGGKGEEGGAEGFGYFLAVSVPGFADVGGVFGYLVGAVLPECYRRLPYPCFWPVVVWYLVDCVVAARKGVYVHGEVVHLYLLTKKAHVPAGWKVRTKTCPCSSAITCRAMSAGNVRVE